MDSELCVTVSGAILGGRWESHRLDDVEWARRHKTVTLVLIAHIPVLFAIGLASGFGVVHMLLEMLPLAGFSVVAARGSLSWRLRSLATTIGLLTSSAMLVHLTGGLTESHFHFFVIVAFLAVYRDMSTSAIALVYVLAHHLTVGVIAPEWVFATESARARPWLWALIHGGYVLALGGAMAYHHVRNEDVHVRAAALAVKVQFQEERHRSALEINDNIVQGLAVAKYALEVGDQDLSERAILQTLEHARGLISDLLGSHKLGDAVSGSLVREHPALVITPTSPPASSADQHMDVA